MESENRKERRSSSNTLIENMLNERKQLLALWLQTSSLDPASLEPEDQDLLEEFCQVLVDYIAAGHFGLYERIVEGKERRREAAETASKIYPVIEKSTQIALEFNEKYSVENNSKGFRNLSKDLSSLGELLSTRMELEDQLIATILM